MMKLSHTIVRLLAAVGTIVIGTIFVVLTIFIIVKPQSKQQVFALNPTALSILEITKVPTRVPFQLTSTPISASPTNVVSEQAVKLSSPTHQNVSSPQINWFVQPNESVEQISQLPNINTILDNQSLSNIVQQDVNQQPSLSIIENESSLSINFNRVTTVPNALQIPLFDTVESHLTSLPDSNFTVTALRLSSDGNWAQVVLVPTRVVESGWMAELNDNEIIEVLAERTNSGLWATYLYDFDEGLGEIERRIPQNFYNLASRSQIQAEQFLFPWTIGQWWYRLRKPPAWHATNAIDFQPVIRNNPIVDFVVLAPAGGFLSLVCDDGQQSTLRIAHASHTTRYLHLDGNTINRDALGQDVGRGEYLGLLYNGEVESGGACPPDDYQFHTPCGCGYGPHLHFEIAPRNAVIDGYDTEFIANAPQNTPFLSSNVPVSSNSPPLAISDFVETKEGEAVTINVLLNDSDPEGSSLSVTGVTNGSGGTVILNPDYTVTYIHNPGFYGLDTFTYTVSDGELSSTGTVTVNVVPIALVITPGDGSCPFPADHKCPEGGTPTSEPTMTSTPEPTLIPTEPVILPTKSSVLEPTLTETPTPTSTSTPIGIEVTEETRS